MNSIRIGNITLRLDGDDVICVHDTWAGEVRVPVKRLQNWLLARMREAIK
jgi:hypothetical protein